MTMGEAVELAQKKAELEKLCDEYSQQANMLLETFSEITNKIFALKECGVAGIQVGIEIMPRIRQMRNQFLLALDADTSEKLRSGSTGACVRRDPKRPSMLWFS